MEKESFLYKTHCELTITSYEIPPDVITKELNITPDRYFLRGEKTISQNSKSIITKPHNLWAIKSSFSNLEQETISHHIKYLKDILLPKKDILLKYKRDSRFEIIFWVWIETDNAGIGLDLNEEEMDFLSCIINNIHFSLIVTSL